MHLRNISASSARLNEVREWAEQHDERTTPDGTKQRGYVDAARAVLDMLRRAPATPTPADALGVRVEELEKAVARHERALRAYIAAESFFARCEMAKELDQP